MAQEALRAHVETLRKMGEHINSPSSLEEIMQNKEDKEAVAFLVTIPSEKTMK